MEYKDLTPELREKVAACKTPAELFALAKAEGVSLTDEQLEAISGGSAWDDVERVGESMSDRVGEVCPHCGSRLTYMLLDGINFNCKSCGYYWKYDRTSGGYTDSW